MALAIRRPAWDPFTSLTRQVDADFDNLARRAFAPSRARLGGFGPAADVARDGSDLLVTLELPGMTSDSDVNVAVTEGRLVITGKRTHDTGTEDTSQDGSHRVLVREIRSGEFRREFALPNHVTGEQVDAEYDRGLLRVRVRGVYASAPAQVGSAKIGVRGLQAPEQSDKPEQPESSTK